MELKPLGDQAVLAYLPDEAAAVRFAAGVRAAAPPWLHDVVPAYATVGVFFDADAIRAGAVADWLRASRASYGTGESLQTRVITDAARPHAVRHTIPVCYEMQRDASRVCEHTALAFDDVIRLHTSAPFTVYAIGFVPGFPYLGYLPTELCGVGRLPSPRTRVEPGSVGLTGRQTGIYPLPRPGGWNLIGRTPLTIVDVAGGFFPIRVGDTVRFERIDDARFAQLAGERIAANGVAPDSHC